MPYTVLREFNLYDGSSQVFYNPGDQFDNANTALVKRLLRRGQIEEAKAAPPPEAPKRTKKKKTTKAVTFRSDLEKATDEADKQ